MRRCLREDRHQDRRAAMASMNPLPRVSVDMRNVPNIVSDRDSLHRACKEGGVVKSIYGVGYKLEL
jgi:hypothetical protein